MNKLNAIISIVDDDPAVRDSLSMMIVQEGFTVSSFEDAAAFLREVRPDQLGCAIVDIRMEGINGMQLQELMIEANIELPIIFLTGHGDIPMSVRAIKAGAVDFLTKPISRERLLKSIQSAIIESEKKLNETNNFDAARSKLIKLTDREKDVMTLAIQGQSNKEIARSLEISHRTVEIHKSKIMHKTGAVNLLDLARIAHEGTLKK